MTKTFLPVLLVCMSCSLTTWTCYAEANGSTQASTNQLGPIYAIDELISKYQMAIENQDISTIEDYRHKQPGRELIELILFHQALYIGGFRGQFKLIPQSGANYDKRLEHLANGRFLASGHTIWFRDNAKFLGKFYLSEPIIRNGEYKVGIYTVPQNTALLSVRKLHELRHFSAVSSRQWLNDWHTLEAMNLKRVHDSKFWVSHIKMLATGRADFMLMPFQQTDQLNVRYNPETYEFLNSDQQEGVFLTPVPNVSVAIHGSRHFAISKVHPKGRETFEQLQIGLKELRKRGLITKALTQSGFFEAKVKDWPIINPSLMVNRP